MSEAHPGWRFGRDQWIVLASLALLALLAWIDLLDLSRGMASMSGQPAMGGMAMRGMAMDGPTPAPVPAPFALTAVMWMVMMLGMMLPSAAPMVLLYAAVQKQRTAGSSLAPTAVFLAAYLVVWGGFSLLAAALQLWLSRQAALGPRLAFTDLRFTAAVLVAAGLYELSPLKRRCLDLCRSPFAFIAARWRPRLAGGWRMGLEHGLFCLGCCWALMLLLFVGGVMNLLWVAALGVLVLAQKLLPGGRLTAAITSGALILAGLALFAVRLVR